MEVTSRTEPIVNYQEYITVTNHKINNVTRQADNKVMIYNETAKEVYIDKQKRIKPKSFSNHNAGKPYIHLAKLKQEI